MNCVKNGVAIPFVEIRYSKIIYKPAITLVSPEIRSTYSQNYHRRSSAAAITLPNPLKGELIPKYFQSPSHLHHHHHCIFRQHRTLHCFVLKHAAV
jgi:hypothetical protein